MATISDELDVQPETRNSRLNEIVAIALVALGLLLFLCLFSYNPNDPSWNAAGESGARNWVGAVGANVAAALFQGIGLAAYLLPALFFAAAWRRVRSRRINAPVSRISGLVMLVLSSAALLSLANIRLFFDASVNAGGVAGAIISRALVAGLNTVGATILLLAITATGVLLATNFSFATFYENLTLAIG
ncbi:MAG: segregation ATPase FtsK/SpoIIIE, family, partial [Blastocatellia bacterium]|nr:segregation ATPase FtsK/SpoIIIE, family [Blastocatellia bacterium]